MKKVLIISDTETHPTTKGNSFAILSQAEMLRKLGCEVHLLFYQAVQRGSRESCSRIYKSMESYWGNYLHYFEVSVPSRFLMNLRTRFNMKFRNGRFDVNDKYPYELTKKVALLQKRYCFDVCIVNYIFLTKIFDYVEFPIKACFTHDTFAYKNLKVGENMLWVDANSEASALQKCSDVLAIQEEEMNYFKVLSPLSNHYTVYTPYKYNSSQIVGNQNIVFLSGGNIFNINGLDWYIKKVHPLIINAFPNYNLVVGGGICNAVKNTYKDIKGLIFEGYIEDPVAFFQKGDIAINPTYQGTGLKIKTFESIANDKVTIVHPHSMSGVFQKDKAPMFSSYDPIDWFNYISSIWESSAKVKNIKEQNCRYMMEYNQFIQSEYKRLLDF